MNKYLQLFRFGNGLMGILGVVAGALIASGLDIADHWMNLVIASAVVVCFIAGGNALNDYVDRDIDVKAHPERPIPSGRMKAEHALYAGILAFTISLLLSFLLQDVLSVMIVVVACVLMLSYELFLKQRGFVGNVTIALLTGMLFLLGGSIVSNVESVIAIAYMAVLVSIGREIAKDIEDMEGDEGRSTLPMRIGVRRASAVASVMLIAGPVLSVWPLIAGMFGPLYYLIFAANAIFIYCSFILHKEARRAQKLCKYAMLIALAAFMLGAVYQ
ncbi:MAG: geranylgeranylglycerol-phosphate geranylgeranyltransferase [Methanomassiliicoccaceae archaeon]|nr:geranylgeranylglycerol-phosphate geranylgeranyltransferase [Methanomassiliicoccaceae archaeon]